MTIACTDCTHVTRYGNCGEPVAAGLVEHFGLVRHPDDSRGCPAFARQPSELEAHAAKLLALGAIDDADAALVGERWHACPEEWAQLLDCCEAAHGSPGRHAPPGPMGSMFTKVHLPPRGEQ